MDFREAIEKLVNTEVGQQCQGLNPLLAGWNKIFDQYRSSFMTSPLLDLYSVEGGVELKVDLPGLTKGDIKLELNDNTLTLSGEHQSSHDQNRDGWYHSERNHGKFNRSIRLPFSPDSKDVKAQFLEGVLTVSITNSHSEHKDLIDIQ